VKNAVPLYLSVDDVVDTAGVKFDEILEIKAVCTATQTLIFIYGTENIVFTCAASPDDSGKQFAIGANKLDQRDIIIAALRSNYHIYRDFELSEASTITPEYAIRIKARVAGSNYNISHSGSVINYNVFSSVSGVDAVRKENYKVLADVHLYTDDGVEIVKMQQVPASDNTVYFDLKDILLAHVSRAMDLPDYNQDDITELTNRMKKYFVRYGVQYGNPVMPRLITQSPDFTAMLGGLDAKMHKVYDENFLYRWCTDPVSGPRRFLTWCPNEKVININQIEFLYIKISDKIGSVVNLRTDIYYKNGSSALALDTGISHTIATDYHKLLCIPVSAYILNFNDDDVAYYDVYLNVDDVQYTEKRRYVADTRCYYSEHYFLFQNSIGGMDTLRTTGDVIEGVRVTRENFESENNRYDYDYAAGQLKNYNIESRRRLKVSTGYCSREYIRYLVNELLMSEAVYEMTAGEADGGEDTWLNPVVVDSNSIEYLTNLRDQFAVTFEVSYSWADRVYTPHADITEL